MTTQTLDKPEADVLAGIKIIDVDTHWSEPADLWTSRAPAAMRDRMPRRKVHNGKLQWMMGDSTISSLGAASCVAKDGTVAKDWSWADWQNEDVHPACWDTKSRVALMDEQGVWAQVVYPNIMGFGGHRAMKIDAELRLAATQIYNDALDEMQEVSGQRLFGMALLPWWDREGSVAEAKRCAARGMRGININPHPHDHGLPDLADPYWNPLWEVCEANQLAVNFHIGASDESVDFLGRAGWPSLPDAQRMSVGGTKMFLDQAVIMSNLLTSDLFDRFPQLTIVSVESGIGWLPFVLQQIKYSGRKRAPRSLTPTEYFRRNMAACFWFENEDMEQIIRLVGEDNVMFETDFPHPACLFPDSYDYVREALGGADPGLIRKVISTNAARIYNIPI
jgi:predicted TIM-barrel fold metal-dependent hydrolase